jgi:hypothetical protein
MVFLRLQQSPAEMAYICRFKLCALKHNCSFSVVWYIRM